MIQINTNLKPAELAALIDRIWQLSATKIRSINATHLPDTGSPVFTVNGQYAHKSLQHKDDRVFRVDTGVMGAESGRLTVVEGKRKKSALFIELINALIEAYPSGLRYT